MHRIATSILVVFISSLSAFSQITEVRRITQTLCDSSMHGRGYVSKGDSIASRFIADEFEEIGLSPYGDTYFQEYLIDQVNTFPGVISMSSGSSQYQPGIDFIVDPSCPSVNISIDAITLNYQDLFSEEKLISSIKEVLESTENALLLDMTSAPSDTLKLLAGLAQSLTEYAPIIEITDTKFTWSVGRTQLKNPLIYLNSASFNGESEFEIKIDAALVKNYSTQNVIAYLPGKRKCKKTLVFTAHYDHLGRMGQDTYFPGANDNASGTAMLLSMAKYFKNNPSKYNLVFIAFSGEEAGLLGSKYYVEHPVFPLKKIEFLINLDIMGSGEDGITVVNGSLFEDEYNLLVEINDKNDLLKRVKKRGPAANSDHYWFTQQGVPAFFIYTEGLNKNYHDVFDVYDNLSFVEYEDITELLVRFVTLKK